MTRDQLKAFFSVFVRATDDDPLQNNRFLILIDTYARAGYQKCSELDIDFDEIKYREGGMQATVQKRNGLANFTDLTFERGIVLNPNAGATDDLTWIQQNFDVSVLSPSMATVTRRNVAIQVYDAEFNLRITHTLQEARIKKFSFGELNAEGSANYSSKLVIGYEGFSSQFQ